MNNYIPNLVPGPGPENSAIGMLSHSIEKQLPDLEEEDATPREIAASLGSFSGFQQAKQRELMEPVLKTYKKDPQISASHEEGMDLAHDIHSRRTLTGLAVSTLIFHLRTLCEHRTGARKVLLQKASECDQAIQVAAEPAVTEELLLPELSRKLLTRR